MVRKLYIIFGFSFCLQNLNLIRAVWYNSSNTDLMALCFGLPQWAGTRKVKSIWITGARDSEWQWHQLGHMQICTSPQTDNHASIPATTQFLQARCPSCHPTNSVKAL